MYLIKSTLKKAFDIREGELRVSLFMLAYIFLIIATLLIIKSAVNSLFLIELGADNLPIAYLFVALFAIATSYLYTRLTERFSLLKIIQFTLAISILALLLLSLLLHLNLLQGWLLYVFYVGVAIYAVLATSQFWVLANLVFNVREAKRLFGFIGAGAIAGGIFGGYLTTLLAPILGNANLMFLAILFLLICFPVVNYIWKAKVGKLNTFKRQKRLSNSSEQPVHLIRKSKHLSYLAGIIGVGVVVARLVDYQFSDFAAKNIPDGDELTSFFGFWLSTFNVISLLIQLFITRKIVGIWGVGLSLLILPILLISGGFLFFAFPELWVVILLKATDGSLKQSINKSAVELLALPIPFQLKNKTKSFIDVVVDSVATGFAGCLLIFFVKGLDLPTYFITILIILLSLVWGFFVRKVRAEYFVSFRRNLDKLATNQKQKKKEVSKESFLEGMKSVFEKGTEKEILFMLNKTQEINDVRFTESIHNLLQHPSNSVKASALRNLYFLDKTSISLEVPKLLQTEDDEVVLATLEYMLLHAENQEGLVFDFYLDHESEYISGAALVALAKEARGNQLLQEKYQFSERVERKTIQVRNLVGEARDKEFAELMLIIGFADYQAGYPTISEGLESENPNLRMIAIRSVAQTLNPIFVDRLLGLLKEKVYRKELISALKFYGSGMPNFLSAKILDESISTAISRLIPSVLANFKSQESVNSLLTVVQHSEDLTVRLESIRALTQIREGNDSLKFDKRQIAKTILEECRLYDSTLNAMHTQIIVYYVKAKKSRQIASEKELNARESLMELLENRLENGLERIFKLLELNFSQSDIQIAYQGIRSEEQEKRTQAIEFLDNILNPNLKSILIPIIESTVLDTSSEEVIELLSRNRLTEIQCFEQILEGKDVKLKLAVLFLLEKIKDVKFLPLINSQLTSSNLKVKSFAEKARGEMLGK